MADESFMLLNLRESKSKKLAQVIGNETSRQILDYLTSKDFATESQISKHLGIPISTTHYNMKALKESGLVVADEFHYSDKGKEVPHYKLAKKFIIIAPRNDEKIMDKIKKFLPVTGIALFAAAIIHGFSNVFRAGSGSLQSMDAASFKIAGDDMANEMVQASARAVPERMAEASTTGAPVLDAMVQNVSNLSQNVSQEFVPVISECVAPPQSWWFDAPIALWFFVGAIFVILVLVVWELVRRKDKS